ncbi:30S ribosomal protein S14 [Candidatus Altiarchaeota archaeon]
MKKTSNEEKKEFNARNLVCSVCGAHRGVIHKYGLEICRRCFREVAPRIGFKKFS